VEPNLVPLCVHNHTEEADREKQRCERRPTGLPLTQAQQQEREVRTALYKALIEGKADRIPELAGWLLAVIKRRSP